MSYMSGVKKHGAGRPRTAEKTKKIRALLRDGLVFQTRGDVDSALKCFDQVFRIEAENTDALFAKCQLFMKQKEYGKSLHLLERCRRSKSDNAQLNYIIAFYYDQLKYYDRALVALGKTLQVRPDFTLAKLLLVKIYIVLDRTEMAKSLLGDISLGVLDRKTQALIYGKLCADLERYDQALKVFRTFLNDPEELGEACQQITRLPVQYWPDDVATTIASGLARSSLGRDEQVRLEFTSARVAEQQQRYDEAFEAYAKANELAKGAFDLDGMQSAIAELRQIFVGSDTFSRSASYVSDIVPVFVVGLPRAGKSSLEDELARYPGIASAKERDLRMYIDDELFVRVEGQLPEKYRDRLAALSKSTMRLYAENYIENVTSSLMLEERPKFIINTIPLNFFNAGVIKMIMPNAKFINMKRDPLDTCWFCYAKNFLNEYYFTNDLEILGAYYNLYDELADHWATVLGDAWLNVRYEELVRDPLHAIKDVLQFLGYQDNLRPEIDGQVGDGLSEDYIGYWRHYERHIQPLIDELRKGVLASN